MFTLLFFTAQVYTIVNYFYLQCVPCYKFSHVKIRDSLYNSKNCCIIYNMLHKLRREYQVYLPQFQNRLCAISTRKSCHNKKPLIS